MQKIPCASDEGMLPLRAPLDERLAVQNVRDGFLRAVMMNPGLRSWLDEKRAAPEGRVNAQFRRHGRESLRARRLRSSCAELIGMDDANRRRIGLVHARFDAAARAGLQSDSVLSVSSAVRSERRNAECTEDHRATRRLPGETEFRERGEEWLADSVHGQNLVRQSSPEFRR